jgi:hypothetical protein
MGTTCARTHIQQREKDNFVKIRIDVSKVDIDDLWQSAIVALADP